METDSYGEAKRFFELTDHQLHNLVYYCHFGAHVSAAPVARRLRSMAARNPQRQGLRFLGLSRNWLAPLVIVAGALLLLFGAYL
ncbi:hypothetical protein FHT86_000938 [Rhizobium sp. BK313]|nr:hypothetical protein [Rhizobium sp. BK313]MBB3452682.1 hypothetical protein [Rhizobium sp. BK313]